MCQCNLVYNISERFQSKDESLSQAKLSSLFEK